MEGRRRRIHLTPIFPLFKKDKETEVVIDKPTDVPVEIPFLFFYFYNMFKIKQLYGS